MEVPGIVEADALEAALFRELRPDLRDIVRPDVGTVCFGEDKPLFVKGDAQQDRFGFPVGAVLAKHLHRLVCQLHDALPCRRLWWTYDVFTGVQLVQ